MQRVKKSFVGLLLVLSAVHAYGEENVTTNILELSPGIGYFSFDNNRQIENQVMGTIGFGMHLSRRWATLLNYSVLRTKSTGSASGENVDMKKYHVDVYRFFNVENRLRPYITAGVGGLQIDQQDDVGTDTQWNAGLGLSYRITAKWFIRSDARFFYNFSGHSSDMALTLTPVYRFAEGERGD